MQMTESRNCQDLQNVTDPKWAKLVTDTLDSSLLNFWKGKCNKFRLKLKKLKQNINLSLLLKYNCNSNSKCNSNKLQSPIFF